MPSDPAAPPRTRRARLAGLVRDTTFRSLRHRNYRLYFLGQIVSFTGSHMQTAALMWLVYDRTGDPLWPPLMLVAQVVPTLLFGTWGGHLADRAPKKQIIARTQLGFLSTAIALTVIAAAGGADPQLFLAVQVVNGLIQSIDLPARLAFVPDLVPRNDLINAVSLNSLLFNVARAVGPALTGGLFLLADAASGAGLLGHVPPVRAAAVGCFALNAVSFVAVLAALARIGVPGDRHAPPDPTARLLDGVRYVAARPVLAGLLLFTGCLSVAGWPALSLFPAYTRTVLNRDQEEYSLLVSGLGAGALVGALATATFGSEARRGLFLAAGAVLVAAGLGGLTLATAMPPAVLAAACHGFGMILFLATGQSALQLSASDEARGKVMALWAMTLSSSAPLGHLVAGAVARRVGVEPVLAAMTAAVAAVAVGVLAVAVVRGWRVR
jgi:predicted MFS family arabinose efflux permease